MLTSCQLSRLVQDASSKDARREGGLRGRGERQGGEKAAEKARQKGDEQAAATAADKATQSRGPSAASPTPSSA